MIQETRKILGLSDDVAITATCVRVPVYNSHSVEINVTFEKDTTPEEIRAILEKAPGVIVLDKPEENVYPHHYKQLGMMKCMWDVFAATSLNQTAFTSGVWVTIFVRVQQATPSKLRSILRSTVYVNRE